MKSNCSSTIWIVPGVAFRSLLWLPRLLLTLLVAGSLQVTAQVVRKKVLFYGPTHEPNGVGAALVNSSPDFWPIGQGSEIWTPGDSISAKDWLKKSQAEFSAFDAIIIGDLRNLDVNHSGAGWEAAIRNGGVGGLRSRVIRSCMAPIRNFIGGRMENRAQRA